MAATITVGAHGREVTTVETPLLVEEAARLVVAGQPDRALVRPLPSERWLYTLRVLERLRAIVMESAGQPDGPFDRPGAYRLVIRRAESRPSSPLKSPREGSCPYSSGRAPCSASGT